MAMIQALGNVTKVRGALIFVEDIEAEMTFYRDVIGLRLLYRTPKFVRFDATQGTSLSLIAGGHASSEPKDFRHGGVVPEVIVDNLRLAMQRLDGAGRPARGGRPNGLGAVLLPLGSGRQSRSSSTSPPSSARTPIRSACRVEVQAARRRRGLGDPRSRSRRRLPARSLAFGLGRGDRDRDLRPARLRQRARRRRPKASPSTRALLSILPPDVAGAPMQPAPEAAAQIAADPSLAADVEAIAVGAGRLGRVVGRRGPGHRQRRSAATRRLRRDVLPRAGATRTTRRRANRRADSAAMRKPRSTAARSSSARARTVGSPTTFATART